jgi:hypothetical protein
MHVYNHSCTFGARKEKFFSTEDLFRLVGAGNEGTLHHNRNLMPPHAPGRRMNGVVGCWLSHFHAYVDFGTTSGTFETSERLRNCGDTERGVHHASNGSNNGEQTNKQTSGRGGEAESDAEYMLLLEDDAEVAPDFFRNMPKYLKALKAVAGTYAPQGAEKPGSDATTRRGFDVVRFTSSGYSQQDQLWDSHKNRFCVYVARAQAGIHREGYKLGPPGKAGHFPSRANFYLGSHAVLVHRHTVPQLLATLLTRGIFSIDAALMECRAGPLGPGSPLRSFIVETASIRRNKTSVSNIREIMANSSPRDPGRSPAKCHYT